MTFKIQKEVQYGQSLSVIGSINELGRWKDFNLGAMKWTDGHVWELKGKQIPKGSYIFQYKYVVV